MERLVGMDKDIGACPVDELELITQVNAAIPVSA
jgi:hypothetical protein